MTCPTCQHWAAISRKQLQDRLDKIHSNPSFGFYHCPSCDGIDWATTEQFVAADPPRKPTRWFGWLRHWIKRDGQD